MSSVSSGQCATAHLVEHWEVEPRPRRLTAGRFQDLSPSFSVLEFQRRRVCCYATVGMGGGIEAFLVTPEENSRAVEFLYSLAHFHRTGAPVGLGHTVYFGEDLWDGSGLDHGFLSFPYIEAPGFESFECGDVRTEFAWLIPITAAERNYKKENGVEALETLFEEHSLDYLNPSRASLV